MPVRVGLSVSWTRGQPSPLSGPCHQIAKRIPRSYWLRPLLPPPALSNSLPQTWLPDFLREQAAGFLFTPKSTLTSSLLCT